MLHLGINTELEGNYVYSFKYKNLNSRSKKLFVFGYLLVGWLGGTVVFTVASQQKVLRFNSSCACVGSLSVLHRHAR